MSDAPPDRIAHPDIDLAEILARLDAHDARFAAYDAAQEKVTDALSAVSAACHLGERP